MPCSRAVWDLPYDITTGEELCVDSMKALLGEFRSAIEVAWLGRWKPALEIQCRLPTRYQRMTRALLIAQQRPVSVGFEKGNCRENWFASLSKDVLFRILRFLAQIGVKQPECGTAETVPVTLIETLMRRRKISASHAVWKVRQHVAIAHQCKQWTIPIWAPPPDRPHPLRQRTYLS